MRELYYFKGIKKTKTFSILPPPPKKSRIYKKYRKTPKKRPEEMQSF